MTDKLYTELDWRDMRIAELEAKIVKLAALKKALSRYGRHEAGCSWRPGLRAERCGMVCNCDLHRTLKELEVL